MPSGYIPVFLVPGCLRVWRAVSDVWHYSPGSFVTMFAVPANMSPKQIFLVIRTPG